MRDCHRCGTGKGGILFKLFRPIHITVSPYVEILPGVPVILIERAVKRGNDPEILVPAVHIPHAVRVDHHEPLVIDIIDVDPVYAGFLAQSDVVSGAFSRSDVQRVRHHLHGSRPGRVLGVGPKRGENANKQRKE